MKFGGSMNSDISPRKLGGIKIVDNYLNKRVSDIFNVRNEIAFDNKNHYMDNKIKTAQVVEQRMENKLRNISPYIGGQKNPGFRSQHEVNNHCLGEYKKFDLKLNNVHENNRINYENHNKKKFEGITKLKNNYRKYSNIAQEENNNNNNNSRVENNGVNTSYRMRNTLNNEKSNKSYYENNSNLRDRSYSPITHRRNQHVDEYVNFKISGTDVKEDNKNISYFEDFNKKNNEVLSSRIRDKSQRRIDLTNKAAERLLKSPNKTEKEILQDVPSIPFEEKLTKDYIREKAYNKSMEMEEIRNKIKYRNEKRDEIHQYWDMNNKLIEKSIDNKDNSINTADDKYFKDHKELSNKVKNDEKIKTDMERKLSSRGNFENSGVKKVTEFCKMTRDLSKIQLKKNIIAKEQETERKMVRSKSTIQGRNLFRVRDY